MNTHDHTHRTGDDHDHDHDHNHGHGHHHPPPEQLNRAFIIGISLNLAFVLIEFGFGLLAESMALIADAGHNLSDVLSLILAWGAIRLAKRQPTPHRTYGFRRGTIFSSLVSSLLLLVAMGAIAWESVLRLQTPAPVAGDIMIGVAAAGVLINGATAWLFAAGRHDDINVRAAFLHMAGDAGVSVGVVLGGIGVMTAGWMWLDPVISLAIVGIIVWSTWAVLLEATDLAFDAVPKGIDPHQVRRYLEGLPGVIGIHDLHIWAMSTTETALTAHLVMPGDEADSHFLHEVASGLAQRFRIGHTTLQVEHNAEPACEQRCQAPGNLSP